MKKILCMAAALALAGTGMAGAFGGIMDMEAGYGYNSAADGIHSAHIEVKPIPKVAVGAEYRHWNNRGNETDVYAKYKIGQCAGSSGCLCRASCVQRREAVQGRFETGPGAYGL